MNKYISFLPLIGSLLLLIAFNVLLGIFIIPYSDISFALLATFAFLSLLLPCFSWFFSKDRIPWWHPIHIFCLTMFYSYIGRFLSHYLSLNQKPITNIDYLNNKSFLIDIFTIILEAGISYFLGFIWIKKIMKKKKYNCLPFLEKVNNLREPAFVQEKNIIIGKVLLLSLFIGLFIRILTISLGLYTGFTAVENTELLSTNFMTPLFVLEDYTRFAYGLSCTVLIKGINNKFPRSFIFYIAIIYIVEEILFLLFFRASKTYLLLYSFFPIFYIIVTQPKKKFFRTMVLSIVGFLLFYRIFTFTFDYIFAYRLNYQKIAGPTFQISTVVFQVAEKSFNDVIEEKYKDSDLTKGANIEDRFAAPDVLVRIYQSMPNPVPFIYFQDFLSAPLAWVPRFILPFKPTPITGKVMSFDVWGANGVGITTFPIGEAYMQMGKLGVVITMFLRPIFQILVFHLCRKYLILDELFFASLMVLIRTVYSVDSLFISSVAGCIQLFVIGIPVVLIVRRIQRLYIYMYGYQS